MTELYAQHFNIELFWSVFTIVLSILTMIFRSTTIQIEAERLIKENKKTIEINEKPASKLSAVLKGEFWNGEKTLRKCEYEANKLQSK